MQPTPVFSIRPKTENDTAWLRAHIADEWGGEPVITHNHIYLPSQLPGFLAVLSDHSAEIVGEVTYAIEGGVCEIVTLASLHEHVGIGTALFNTVEAIARAEGCRRLMLITTNDNLNALGFYQKRGMRLAAIYPNALDQVRIQKPNIPRVGMNDIPLRDEILLEKRLT